MTDFEEFNALITSLKGNLPKDFRSDCATQPTKNMRDLIARIPHMNNVFNEDDILKKLETKAAALLGKEASLLVHSGTFGNFLAVATHCPEGALIFTSEISHMGQYEDEALEKFLRCSVRKLRENRGIIPLEQVLKEKFTI